MLDKQTLTHEEVLSMLPHRSPMLLIDTVEEVVPLKYIRAKFYVREDWEILKGHFPGNPLMPGVLSVECMAQAADLTIMSEKKYASLIPLFAGIKEARFYKKITPGNTIYVFSEVIQINEQRSLITCSSKILLDDELAASAEVTIAMR